MCIRDSYSVKLTIETLNTGAFSDTDEASQYTCRPATDNRVVVIRSSYTVSYTHLDVYKRQGSRPRLIICGGGHVSAALVRMASLLAFDIWVIERCV